ncbi:MAG: cystine ABC transporter substrate-binding protein [Pseudomonadaceae bacterium]|uniref:Cystine transporter subunit periplasmic-binding component of ABC superfamily n=1 Tax=Pseudomonas marincola TaxID=437900 RepID=A0A1I7CNS2_9PSED|nr:MULTISPECIES: cystine ABC transporter substrate-binding protein [Pseudomonas]MBQ56299.1 cystine ABC transporter substrate-binding protein [Pseudomonadaceae bacterium]NRH28238.1 cystine ABC transporter substrate-binding protein [Pseudomonas sp. MS19]OEO27670.1 cystine transporter subunit [Pseudomonas sp. J237]CAE6900239.1 cystine ABC transporter periplasmic binding protein [Pseudomonas marincola]SFU00999.1 cystine transport system substrate-binding protein [Pseudomonas marincola]
MKLATLRRHFLITSLGLILGSSMISSTYAAELLEHIKSTGKIQIGLEGTYPPFNFQDADGKLTGFEVDFAKALAAKLGVEAAFQPTKWDGILAALESKRLDVVINQVTITDERKKKYDFSTPYTVSGIQALTRKGEADSIKQPADLAGKRVGVGLGTAYETWLKENVPQADIKTYDDDPTKFQDLMVGRLDVILVDRLAAFEMVEKTSGKMAVAGEPFSRQESAVAMRKGDPELLAAIDKAMAEMRADGSLKAISEKWFKSDVTQ